MRRILTLAATAAIPLLVLGIFFVVPVAGIVSRGFVQDGQLDVAGVFAVLGRPEIQRAIWFTLWSSTVGTVLACLLGLPAAHVLHRLRFPGRTWVRALLVVPFVLPTVVVGVAFELVIGRGGPLGRLGLDGSPIAIVAGLVFFNASVVIRVVGGAWESLDPRPAEAAAALGASPWQVLRDVTFPALRPALVSAATVVFLFCATAFGIVLTLGGLRYSSVETQIYLLTTDLLDLQAAAALSVLQLVVVTGLLVAAARARRTPDGTVVRSRVRLRRPGLGDLPAVGADLRAGRAGGAAARRPGRAVDAGRRRLEPGQLPRPPDPRLPPGPAGAGHHRPGELPADRRRRDLDVPAPRALAGDDRDPPLAHPRRAPAAGRTRRALHAAAGGLGGDPRLRLPGHARPPAPRPARLPAADPGRPGPRGPAAGGADPGPGAGRDRRPAAPGRGHPGRLSSARARRGRPPGRSGSRSSPRPGSRSPAPWGSSGRRRSWSATTGRRCRS